MKSSTKAWLAGVGVFLIVVAGMAVVGIWGAVDGMERIAGEVSKTESRRIAAPDGSVVLLGDDTVATIVDILGLRGGIVLGLRGGIAGSDSIMVYQSAVRPEVSMDRFAGDGALVGMIEPVRDWTLPITIRLEQPRSAADTAFPHGRVNFSGSQVSLPVFSSRKPR